MADMLLPGFERIDTSLNTCAGCALQEVYLKTTPDERIAMFGVTCHSAGCLGKIIVPVVAPIPARANDPHTSKTAATKVKRASIKDYIMFTLAIENPADSGGYAWTGTELAERTGLRLNSITPRFAELRRAGKIKATTTARNGELAWVLV